MKTFPFLSPLPVAVFAFVSCYFGAVCTGWATETRSNWATEAYQKNYPSVVFIQGDKVEERRGNTADPERAFNGMGSGIIIDERGYIITNYHVVRDIRKIQVKTHDKKDYIGTLIAKDDDTDLAIIKIAPQSPLRPITFGRSNDLMPGEVCIAIGNPYGYDYSLTDGRISAVNREVGVNDTPLVYRAAIQTNTEINPGNSGGPLINVEGEMIGINVAMRQGAIGIAFAAPVDQVVEVAAKLIGELVQVTHGITISQNEPSDYNALKRFVIRVESVESNSPAAQAGIQTGDILFGIGKYTLKNKLDFYRALLDLKANEDIAFTVFRNSELHDVAVAVGGPKGGAFARRTASSPSPQSAAVASKTAASATPNEDKSSRGTELDRLVWENLGIRYTAIPSQEFERTYAKFLPVFDENGNLTKPGFEGGIIVKSVREGSPAEQAGLTIGDVIVGIGPWAMIAANDVRYVGGQEWAKLRKENESLSSDVIRDNIRYNTEIPMR